MARVSLKSIAKEVGVSITAVSLVLSGKEKEGRVGKDMAEKIRLKAKEMHYEPNNLARGLRVGRSQTIGLIVADISNLFFANLAFHIQEHAEKFGYSVIITNTNESDLKLEKMVNVLKRRPVDGFIIVPTEHGKPFVEDLVKRNIPVVLIDRYFPEINAGAVVVDNYNASGKAVKNLIGQGCKNIGLVIYKSRLLHMQQRKSGYIDAITEHGFYNPDFIKEINYSHILNDVSIAIESLMLKENHIDGLFFATNTLSMLGIKQLMDMNLQIPEDVKVVCFDKSDAFDFTSIPIPYIRQPVPEMGKKAVELLFEQIRENTKDKKCIELQASLINSPVD
ncbi:MAG: LacI family transcriptional regulator [Tannerella sp.]|jgi:LacI family transcriptional regulator|nr:LacI family transcriptional regulator [Tannerella sp.]